MQLRTKLIIYLFSFSLVLFSVYSYFGYKELSKAFMELTADDFEILAHDKANNILTVFDYSFDIVEHISDLEKIQKYVIDDEKEMQDEEILKALIHHNISDMYSAIYIMDLDGNVFISTDETFVGKNYSFRPYFVKAREGNRSVYGAVGATSGKLGYYFAVPIKINEETKAVLVGKLDPTIVHNVLYNNERLHHISSVKRIGFLLINEKGIIFHSENQDDIYKTLGATVPEERRDIVKSKILPSEEIGDIGCDMLQDAIREGIESEKRTECVNKISGRRKYIELHRIDGTDFFIVAYAYYDQIMHYSSNLIAIFLLFFSLFIVLILLFVSIILGRSLKPLDELSRWADIVKKGKYDQRINIGGSDEFKKLGSTFNLMMDRIENVHVKLKKEFDVKTEKVEKMNRFMVKRELKMVELKKQIKKKK